MTVEELIKKLSAYPPETYVILSGDAEGNNYSGAAEVDLALLEPGYDGGRTEDVIFEDDLADDPESYEERDYYTQAVVIWPV